MARKTDLVAAASRRYQKAVEAHAKALAAGDEKAIAKAADEVEAARKRIDALVSTSRPLIGAAAGGAAGAALGSVAGPAGAAIGGGAGAAIGGYLTTPKAPLESASAESPKEPAQAKKEIRKLKAKLLR